MYVIWAIVIFGALTGAYALFDSEAMSSTPSAINVNLASSMSVYRQAVVSYALDHPSFNGQVTVSLPTAQTAPWQNYVMPNSGGITGSLVVVYGVSPSSGAAASQVEQLAQGSALAGVARGGYVESPGNSPVQIPQPLASSVPNGALVWMAQAYE